MKKIYVILAAAVAAMMVLSCQKTVETTEEISEVKRDIRTVQFVYPSSDDPDSKVYLNDDGETGWQIGDVITIHGKVTSENKYVTLDGVTNTISADKKTATVTVDFTGMTPDDSGYGSFFAAYPHSAFVDYDADADRSRCFNCYNNTNQLLLSGRYDSVNDKFEFFNVTGALSFIVDGSSFGDFDEYIITGKNNELVGYDHYNTRVASGAFTFNHYSSSGAKNFVRGTVVDDGTTVNTVYFPVTEEDDTADNPGERATCVDFSHGFYIYFLKSGVITHMASTSESVRIERQSLTKLGVIPTSKIKEYSAPTEHVASHPAITGAEAKDATGNANCYIVDGSDDTNKGKVFKFKAVKGNSAIGVGAISSVEILWETYNNATSVSANSVIAQADFDKKDGDDDYYITFKMPNPAAPAHLQPGNALIAAKDVYGTVLWSWHIWVPSTAITSSTYGNVSKVRMMDRNLGALVIAEGDAETDAPIESAGMFYQWGRKDPFIGTQSFGSSSLAKYSGTFATREKTSYTEIYKYPNSFVLTGYDADGYKDWSTTTSDALWGSTKTENDPCPPGWKVPYSSNSGDLWDNAGGSLTELPGFSFNVAHHWFRLGVDFDALSPTTTGYVYFPLPGYKVQSNGNIEYKGSRTSIIQANTEGGNNEYTRTILFKSGSDFKGFQWERKARGCSVRCVVE